MWIFRYFYFGTLYFFSFLVQFSNCKQFWIQPQNIALTEIRATYRDRSRNDLATEKYVYVKEYRPLFIYTKKIQDICACLTFFFFELFGRKSQKGVLLGCLHMRITWNKFQIWNSYWFSKSEWTTMHSNIGSFQNFFLLLDIVSTGLLSVWLQMIINWGNSSQLWNGSYMNMKKKLASISYFNKF